MTANATLAELVNCFSDVCFSIGLYSDNSSNGRAVVTVALDKYRECKGRYHGDATVYDAQINDVLSTFPDMNSVPRL